MPKSAAVYRTQTEIANSYGVNQRTVARWVTVPGFPKKGKGGWTKRDVDQFVADSTLGKGPTEHKVNGVTLTEANIRKTIEDAENARIKKEMLLVEQAKQLGEIAFVTDVRADFSKIIATITECADAMSTAIDRALPDAHPSSDVWPELRAKVMAIADKLPRDIGSAVSDLW